MDQSISAALRAHELMEVARIKLEDDTSQSDDPYPPAWTSINLKLYPRLLRVSLPRADRSGQLDFLQALDRRRSVRQFDDTYTVTLQVLGAVLDLALSADPSSGGYYHRPYPSAGARHPIEVYLLALNIEHVLPGIYHYNSHDHYLTILLEKDLTSDIADVLGDTEIVSPSFIIILSAVFHRSSVKYGGRGYRYALLEAGAVAQTLDLICRTANLGVVWVGGFPDTYINELLDVNWELELESPVIMLAAGYEKLST